jgi:cation transport regulator ChaB
MNTRRKLELHAQTLGTALNRGAQANFRGATQVLHRVDRGAQAGAQTVAWSQVLDRGAQAAARGPRRRSSSVAGT